MNTQPEPSADQRKGALTAAGVIVGLTAVIALLAEWFQGARAMKCRPRWSRAHRLPTRCCTRPNSSRSQSPSPAGYSRDKFGQKWADVDRNGCDQLNDVLRRDLRKRHTKLGTRGCVMQSGVLFDTYGSSGVKFKRGDGDIEIDHVISLHDAWTPVHTTGTKSEGRSSRTIS
jgi:hypothetical protein